MNPTTGKNNSTNSHAQVEEELFRPMNTMIIAKKILITKIEIVKILVNVI